MSVLIIGKFQGDTATFRQALVDLLVVDEWESVEQFQKFMADPELQAFIGSVGAAPVPPEVIVAEAISSSDEF